MLELGLAKPPISPTKIRKELIYDFTTLTSTIHTITSVVVDFITNISCFIPVSI